MLPLLLTVDDEVYSVWLCTKATPRKPRASPLTLNPNKGPGVSSVRLRCLPLARRADTLPPASSGALRPPPPPPPPVPPQPRPPRCPASLGPRLLPCTPSAHSGLGALLLLCGGLGFSCISFLPKFQFAFVVFTLLSTSGWLPGGEREMLTFSTAFEAENQALLV